MTDAHAILDRCLDDYEHVWQRNSSLPSLLQFYEQKKIATATKDIPTLARELAMIDLEHRWRRFFNSVQQDELHRRQTDHIPLLPRWADYCRLLKLDPPPIAGIRHEFSVRQLFGDRPGYQMFCDYYAEHAAALVRDLPDCAAELSRAHITVYCDHRLLLTTSLPGRLEIGRRRTSEPAAPCCVDVGDVHRLIVSEHDVRSLSRNQIAIEVIALDRVSVRNEAPAQGRLFVELFIEPSILKGQDHVMEVELPCRLRFSRWEFSISVET